MKIIIIAYSLLLALMIINFVLMLMLNANMLLLMKGATAQNEAVILLMQGMNVLLNK